MKNNSFIKFSLFAGVLAFGISCTNLDEKILDATETSKADPNTVLATAYAGLREFQGQDGIYAMQEVSTDLFIVPTRAGDWGDGGAWLQDHRHTWDSNSREINTSWRQMLSSVYNCDLALAIAGIPPAKEAQAKFLKAYYYYNAIDLFGQVPYREAGGSPDDFPKVWDSPTATAKIIALLEEALQSLPARNASDPSIASKDAANFLLAKIYLNKAVFDATTHTGFNANNVANMNKVIQYVNAISAGTRLANDYWDNFKPANNTSPELIFSAKNILGVSLGAVRTRWYMGGHYNQIPSGWNGFSVLQDYYNQYTPNDRRILNNDNNATFGSPLGMRIGQQYDAGGVTALKTRAQNGSRPLNFQSDLAGLPADGKIVADEWLERWGIRPQKYLPDVSNLDKPENDYVLFRYADALLMKAEAIARGGSGSIGTIQTDLQTRVGISTPMDLSTLAGIYTARATELWGEGWRRNDMIRFGKYTTARPTMTNTDAYRVLLPVPNSALLNPNIKQNPGYTN